MFFFNIKAQLEYALCIFIKYYLHLCPDYFNYPGSYFFIKKGFSSLLGLIILAPMRAKFCNSKGDTRQTGKGLNCLTVFSVEQAVLLKLIRLFKLLSTQHNCTIYLCYFWLVGLCNPLICWHDFGHLYWKLAFKCTHMHTLLFTSFFLLFFLWWSIELRGCSLRSPKDSGKYVRSEKGTDTASVTKAAVKDTPLNSSLNSYFKTGALYCWSPGSKNNNKKEAKLNQIQAVTKWKFKGHSLRWQTHPI